MKKNNILCLDLSMGKTGFSVFSNGKLINYGLIDTTKIKENSDNIHSNKLAHIYYMLKELDSQYNFNTVIIEEGFVRHNKSTKILAKARGVAEVVFCDKIIVLYSVKFIKKKTTNNGNASKDDMIKEINKLYKLELTDDNIADSIALGHYHINKEKEVE